MATRIDTSFRGMETTDQVHEPAISLSACLTNHDDIAATQSTGPTPILRRNSSSSNPNISDDSQTSLDQTSQHSSMSLDIVEVLPHHSPGVSAIPSTSSLASNPSSNEVGPLDLEAYPQSIDDPKRSSTSQSTQLFVQRYSLWRQFTDWTSGWGWEAAACVFSLASFAATIALLSAFNGKARPDWPYGITLNSAMSLLSNIIKASLLVPAAACISQSIWIRYSRGPHRLAELAVFDSASRGPWGALQLLWMLRAR